MKELHQPGDFSSMGETISFKVKEWILEPDCLHLNPSSTAFKECNLSYQMRNSLFCKIVGGLHKHIVNECKHYGPHRELPLVLMRTKFKTKDCVIINQVNLSSITIPHNNKTLMATLQTSMGSHFAQDIEVSNNFMLTSVVS